MRQSSSSLTGRFDTFTRGIDARSIAENLATLDVAAGSEGNDIASILEKLRGAAGDVPLPEVDEADIVPALAWLPFSLDEAIQLIGLTRLVNRRITDGYYRERLTILATQEKSASTLHEVAILSMHRHSGGLQLILPMPRGLMGGPLAMAGQASFHYGLLLHLPNGGVIRGEFRADPQTIWMLHRTLGCKRVVLTRHPADRLVALYCMRHEGLRERMKKNGATDLSEEAVMNALFRGGRLPANIGCLRANLGWLDGWLEAEARENALIVRYEDMFSDTMTHFSRIHEFLYGRDMDPALIAELESLICASGEGGALQSGETSNRAYPKGYSGKVGVWRDYLTRSNVETYNDVVRRFLDYTERVEDIMALYPDLVLDDGERDAVP